MILKGLQSFSLSRSETELFWFQIKGTHWKRVHRTYIICCGQKYLLAGNLEELEMQHNSVPEGSKKYLFLQLQVQKIPIVGLEFCLPTNRLG